MKNEFDFVVRYRLSGKIIFAMATIFFLAIFVDAAYGYITSGFSLEPRLFWLLFIPFSLIFGLVFLFLFIKHISFKVSVKGGVFYVKNLYSFSRQENIHLLTSIALNLEQATIKSLSCFM